MALNGKKKKVILLMTGNGCTGIDDWSEEMEMMVMKVVQ